MTTQTNGSPVTAISKTPLWTGRIVSGLAVSFLLFDGVIKLVQPMVVVESTRQLEYPESDIAGIGIVLLACPLLYIPPRTSILRHNLAHRVPGRRRSEPGSGRRRMVQRNVCRDVRCP